MKKLYTPFIRIALISLMLSLLFSSCAYVTTLRTKEINSVGDEVKKNNQEIQTLRLQLDSLREEQSRLQKRLKADMMSVLSRVTEESERMAGKMEENQYRLDLLIGKSDKILSKKVVIEKRVSVSGDSAVSESNVKTMYDLDVEKMYNTAKSDFYAKEYKLAFDGFKQVYEKQASAELSESSLFWMARCLVESGLKDRAVTAYERLLKEFPDGRKACVTLFHLSNVAQTENKTSKRVDYLQKIIDAPNCTGSNEALKAADMLKNLSNSAPVQ